MLAAKCGMAEITIRQYESGNANPEPAAYADRRCPEHICRQPDPWFHHRIYRPFRDRCRIYPAHERLKDTGMMLEITPDIRDILRQSKEARQLLQRLLKYTTNLQAEKDVLLLLTDEHDIRNAVDRCFENTALKSVVLKENNDIKTFFRETDARHE